MVMSLTGTSGKEDYGFTVRLPKREKTLLLNQRVTRIDITDDRLQKDFAQHFLLSSASFSISCTRPPRE